MEENKDDIIYDLDSQESQAEAVMGSGHSDRWPEGPVTSTVCDITDDSHPTSEAAAEEPAQDQISESTLEPAPESDSALAPSGAQKVCASCVAVRMTAPHNSDCPEPSDTARAEIDRLVGEMGAETLLDIIRDNRNAAIRQIISEVEASRDRTIPSGDSASMGCTSIFDLAALA